jgi:hypothetical protein
VTAPLSARHAELLRAVKSACYVPGAMTELTKAELLAAVEAAGPVDLEYETTMVSRAHGQGQDDAVTRIADGLDRLFPGGSVGSRVREGSWDKLAEAAEPAVPGRPLDTARTLVSYLVPGR